MPKYGVRGYENGVWDKKDCVPVEAESEIQAVTLVFGAGLIEAGKPGQLRAECWPASKPSAKKFFYVPSKPPFSN